MKFSIRLKLFTIIAFLVVALGGLGALTYIENQIVTEKIDELSEDSIPHTLDIMRLQTCVVQIQQWLTDISVTRAAEGFDDGFDEAKTYYDEATEIITRLQDLTIENEIVSNLQKDLDNYYEMGQKMADRYINGGTEEGNKFMGQFDPFAEKITSEIQQLADLLKAELNEQSTSSVKKIHNNTTILLITFVIVLAFSILFLMLISHSITSPIGKVVKMLKDISSGEGDLTKRLDINSKDEVGELASHFNTFVSKLHTTIFSMVGSIDAVELSASQVDTALDTASGGVADASGRLEKATEAMDTTSQMTHQMTSGINGMVDEMQGITDDISLTTEKSKTIHENSNEGMKNMQELNSIMSSVEEETKSAFNAIEDMEKASTEVEKVVEMVRNIADETRLLALNANIEAARAGEQGKGFSVVAGQVSKLADESISSVDQIVSIIEQIQMNSTLSFESMQKSRDLVSEASGKVNATVGQFTQISTEIGSINSLMNDLMTSTNELNSDSKNVSTSMDTIVKNTSTAFDQLANVSAAIEEQVATLEEVSACMKDVASMTVDLKKETGQFNVE